MVVVSRKAAKSAGLKYYFTGKPCKRGHVDRRFVSSFWCMSCCREKSSEAYRDLSLEQRRDIYKARRDYLNTWAAENRDKIRENKKQYKAKNPDYIRKRYAKHRKELSKKANDWYHANKERALITSRAWAASNPEKRRAYGRRSALKRRAIKKRVFVEAVDPVVVFERDKGKCGICMKPVERGSNWEIDHIMPISKGGAHCYANVQLAHRTCNRAKAAKLPTGQPTLWQVAAS